MFSCTSEECKISLDLFFDLVGGASIDVINRRSQEENTTTEHASGQFTQFFNNEEQRLFYGDNESKKFAVEVLYIKILIFIDLLKKASDFHLRNRDISLGFSDKNIIVSIPSSKGRLPLIWNFSIELLPVEDQNPEDINEESGKDQSRQFENISDETFSSQELGLALEDKRAKSFPDFHRLGRIFLRGLLVNDWNTMGEIDEQIKHMTETMEGIGSKELVNPGAVRNMVMQQIEQSKEIFASGNIIYREGDRVRLQDVITEEIWDEIIVFAFDMLTAENLPDFTEDGKDVNDQRLDIELGRFVSRLEEISRLIKVELFHEQFQKKDIGKVLNAFLTEDQSVND